VSSWDRRSVLLGGATLLGGAAALGGCPQPAQNSPKDTGGRVPKDGEGVAPDGEVTVGEVLPILVAIADVLIPADELGPGARAAGCDVYFERALADPRMRGAKNVLTRGSAFLGRLARLEHQKPFWELGADERDAILRRLANNEVRPNGFQPHAFMRVMLALTLESFLGDPRHGGNKDEVGWKLIGGLNWAGRTG
jgi:hypothetical protein